MNDVVERVMKAVNFNEVQPVPVALWDFAPWMPSMLGINATDYYRDVETKLKVQTEIQRLFPETILFPGLFPDYGVIIEAVSLGCEFKWLEDDAPFAMPCLHSAEDIKKLRPADPDKDGLMPVVLNEYKYMWKNADKRLIDEYGYLDGVAVAMGPAETAGLLRGYDGLFYDMFDNPELVHKMLEIVTESIMIWIRAQEKVNGKLKRLFIVDHLSTQLSPKHYEEFFHPYLKQIFTEFKDVEIRLWHNEGRSAHIFSRIPDLGCNIYQFGEDKVEDIKAAIGDRICLMGNLHSVKEVRNASEDEVYKTSLERLRAGAPGGGFLLSGAGGLAPGTSVEKVRAMIRATVDYAAENHG